jgi:hypothetical protein
MQLFSHILLHESIVSQYYSAYSNRRLVKMKTQKTILILPEFVFCVS